MQVAQRGLTVASHNLSHASDANYARQSIQIRDSGTQYDGDILIGSGAHIEQLVDARNAFLDTQILSLNMDQGLHQSQYDSLSLIENAFGELLDRHTDVSDLSGAMGANTNPMGISKSLDDLFVSFTKWAATPNAIIPKQTVLESAEILSKNFHAVVSHIQDNLDVTQDQMSKDAMSVTELLKKIAGLNKQILDLENSASGQALDVRGERQNLLESLANYLNFKVSPSEIDSKALKLTISDINGNDIVLLDATQSFGPLEVVNDTVLLNGIELSVKKGTLAGYQTVIQKNIPEVTGILDHIANQIVTAVNKIYNPANDPQYFFFDPSGVTAANITLNSDLNANNLRATLTSAQGANEIGLELENLRNQKFFILNGDNIDGTLNEAYSGLLSYTGKLVNDEEIQLSSTINLLDHTKMDRANIMGVSFEEEMSSLMTFSRLYQGNLRVLKVVDECLEQMLNII